MSDLHQTLSDLHRELEQAERLAPQDRALLEDALGDIQRALQDGSTTTAPADAPGHALEGAAVRLEAGHPGLATAVRTLVDALSKAGI
jgi:hypothetical protein